jgi:hypothetical protein
VIDHLAVISWLVWAIAVIAASPDPPKRRRAGTHSGRPARPTFP